jgi:hypothetical protein
MTSYKYKPDYSSSFCAKEYKEKGLMLYALVLKYDIVDITSLASTSLTDNKDDKGIDVLHFIPETRTAIIVQGYMAEDETKPEAKAKKASDFNTAITWALAQPIENVPGTIRANVTDLRQGINDNEVTQIEFWYVHNLDESGNVKKELEAVEATAKALLGTYFPAKNVSVRTLEVGNKTIESWYKSKTQTILVDDEIEAEVIHGGYVISDGDWKAFDTSVSIKWVHELFQKYGSDLFSADIRGYLGSVQINNQIKETCSKEPVNFWVYNNGITCLVHTFDYKEREKKIKLKGISIINGAQTTGAIGSVTISGNGYLPIRFITSDKSEIWHNMVLYNNSQNEIYSSDFRSNDEVQKRLREEFNSIPETHYLGRRGGIEDARKRDPNLISTEKAAISLVAFHGDPSLTYHKRAEIWSDKYYSKYYNSDLSAKHLVFTYSLYAAIEKKKDDLRHGFDRNQLSALQQEEYDFFKKRGGMRLYLSAMGQSMEEILNKKIPNPKKLSFGIISWKDAVDNWKDVIDKTVMYCNKLRPGIDNGILKDEYVKSSMSEFKRAIASQVAGVQSIYDVFQKKVKLD